MLCNDWDFNHYNNSGEDLATYSNFNSNLCLDKCRTSKTTSHSRGLVNGTPNSASSGYGWTEPAAVNPNWLQSSPPSMHPEP
ncbi:hypothetical protein L1987_54738 [Smallanthus sonchifolius]|uniref:Uncharacterized protein n=1 Tax=Smallanthus sonchifolius TaxID=185202 RepID=A0ACB9E913_9ASTR|nr:hypothetical protein L1987_54738 [Smallanthus sonchifolius]